MEESSGQDVTPPTTETGTAGGVGGARRRRMTVLVAIDEGEGSLYALSWSLDNLFTAPSAAAAAGGETPTNRPSEQLGKLILVHAQRPLLHFMHPVGPAVYSTSSVVESVKKAQEESSRNLLNKALQICKQRLVNAETVVVDGDPKEMICQVAEQMQADLLVVGSRGLGPIKRAILGSVSDYCAHHVKCPILIVKPPRGSH